MSKIQEFEMTTEVAEAVAAKMENLTKGSPLHVTLIPESVEFELSVAQRANIFIHQQQMREHPGVSENKPGTSGVGLPSEFDVSDLGKPIVAIDHRTGEELVGTLEFFSNSSQKISQSKFGEDWETQVYLRGVPKEFLLNNRHWTVAVYSTYSD